MSSGGEPPAVSGRVPDHPGVADSPGFADDGTPGDDYNSLPYPAMPVTLTQPPHLAALATLFGLEPPDIDRARVLELGCASGGNVIPLAMRFPLARFHGVDLARRHIDDGNRRIAELALGNVTLEQGDLTTLDLSGRQFDYVICHGVFSWVPRAAQDAIFRICRETLAPNGVVTISYNVLPGWHLRMVIRDLCRHYAGTDGTPRGRVAKARAALRQIAEASDAAEPYGLLLRTEAKRLKDVPSAYILGEFLTPNNAPCHVQEFIARAADAGLDYLCEADLSAAVPPGLDPTVRRRIAAIAGSDRAAAEQHVDFLTGRLFRRSVLVRRQPALRPPAEPDPGRLARLHLAAPLRLDSDQTTTKLAVFADNQGRPISTGEPAVHRALARLASAFPESLTVAELAAGAGSGPDGDAAAPAGAEARLSRALLAIVLAGRASISVLPVRVGRAEQERPLVWRLARAEAATSQPWITSPRHTAVPVHPVLRVLLPLLDGQHDRAALRAHIAGAWRAGEIQVPELPADQPPPSPDRLAEVSGEYVERGLLYLARQGLLEADGDPRRDPT